MSKPLTNIKDVLSIIFSTAKKIFIIGHNNADLDYLASAIGLQSLCTSYGKEAYIILDESAETIEPVVKRVRDDNISTHNIIDMNTYYKLKDENSSLIVTDTNKTELVAVRDDLDDFQDIIIIDHHAPGPTTINNAYQYIPLITDSDKKQKAKVSSASEIVAQLLLAAKVNCPKDVYTYLYSGIYMDTNRFDKNVGDKTHEIIHILCSKGADTMAASELLVSDFNEDKIIYNLIINNTILKAYEYDAMNNYTIAFTLNRENPETIYRRESLAKAADKLLKYKIDASFAMGKIDPETLSISARSKGKIDVGKIMEYVGGGGNSQNAASQIKGLPLTTLEDLIFTAIERGVKVDGEVQSPKDSSIISSPSQYVKKNS